VQRYGFNGQEVENGITGERTHTSAEFWMHTCPKRFKLGCSSLIWRGA
jgi:hypothetical protein